MNVLQFETEAECVAGIPVRKACFQPQSCLPVPAACLVANTARDVLAAAIGAPVKIRLLAPRIPAPDAWLAITSGAHLFTCNGPVADATLVLRAEDALTLAAAVFGEPVAAARDLSALEREVLERIVRALRPAMSAVCGVQGGEFARIRELPRAVTYFELLVESPIRARVGIALSRDPAERAAAQISADAFRGVEMRVRVESAGIELRARALAGLRPGDDVSLGSAIDAPVSLTVGNRVVARGVLGVAHGRHVVVVSAS